MSLSNRVRKTEINDKEFQIYMLKGLQGALMAKKLASLVTSFLSAGSGNDGEIEIDFTKIAEAISNGLSDQEFSDMLGALLKEMTVDGREVNFDDYFAANYGELFQVISFALQENFSSFFGEMVTSE